jgi:hypothetical protein
MDHLIHKIAEADKDNPLKFVLSTDDTDLVGDVVVQSGLSLARDPLPAQIDHGGSMHDLVGSWKELKIGAHKTVSTLELMPKGTSPTVDLIHAIRDAGIRMAASIGFVPGDWEAIWDKKAEFITGFKFLKSTLIEASIVVTPANPNALQLAKSMVSRGLRFPIQPVMPKTVVSDWHRRERALAMARKILNRQTSKI